MGVMICSDSDHASKPAGCCSVGFATKFYLVCSIHEAHIGKVTRGGACGFHDQRTPGRQTMMCR